MTQNSKSIRSVCVYCGSQPGNDDAFLEAGKALGTALAGSGLRLVYGGGTRGIMGAVAKACMDNGGKVTGIIPSFLMDKEATRDDLVHLDELIETEDMHQRKHAMFEHSDAFVTLPGGIGTLEEIIEIMTWAQLGRHEKPMVLANINGFWAPLLELLSHMSSSGFIHTAHLVKPLVIDNASDIVPTLLAHSDGQSTSGDSDVIARL